MSVIAVGIQSAYRDSFYGLFELPCTKGSWESISL